KHLTIAERYFIEKWKSEGKSNRTIAGLLGKAPQTIHNEVKRGLVRQQIRRGKFEMIYQADYAQDSYEMKRRKSVRSVGLDKDTKDKIL
ncbi:helix-turn-helix domain-containing protein, partial [Streptococcus pyogenes]